MFKYFIFVSIVLVLVESPNPCGQAGGFACPDNNRCCRKPDGRNWGCCPGLNAVCCADGVSCCPGGTICDLNRRQCVPTKPTKVFLTLLEEPTHSTAPIKLEGYEEFLWGFVNGTQVLSNIPSLNKCHILNNTIAHTFEDLIETIENATLKNLDYTLNRAIDIGHVILEEVRNNLVGCPSALNQTYNLVNHVIAHVSTPDYFSRISNHATASLFDLITRFQKISNFFNQTRHYEAGLEAGSAFNFLFFFDFHN